MPMDGGLAKATLDGILGLACRISKADPKKFHIKYGGGQAAVDWYVNVQNVDALVNTKKARDDGLIRRTFGIFGEHTDSVVVLRIREWDASKQDDDYRITWQKPADDMKARSELAGLLAQSIQELGSSFSNKPI